MSIDALSASLTARGETRLFVRGTTEAIKE
jgi:hypothetical protein